MLSRFITRTSIRSFAMLTPLALRASPAFAAAGGAKASFPQFAVFALGFTALVIGHFGARREPPR